MLPFSSVTETGDYIVMRGMEMGLVPVPLHNMVLDCGLVKGTVAVGVRHALPVDDVELILGNDLAGGVVWANVPPPPLVAARPLYAVAWDDSGRRLPEVFPVCAVTRAQGRDVASPDSCESQ